MIDLGKGVSVDFKESPYVFGIEGCNPIRVQKGKGRITGVSLEQLELIVKTIKESRKHEQRHDNADTKRATTRKVRSANSGNTKARASNRPIPE